jgi:16S rRNA (cytidine1402-2'-O)-methyltransferase
MTDQSTIFVVATPIGNLDDLSPRALATLKNVDIIAAEDTRNTLKLLSHYNIKGKELLSYHDHGEGQRAEQIVERLLEEEKSLALVSDAGTPCVSDPGYRLIRLARSRGIRVHPIPGPSAVTSLISASGLASNRFTFVGFLPAKASDRQREVESWQSLRGSVVFFEATRRLDDALSIVGSIYPHAMVAVGRELTKLFEEIVTLPVSDAVAWVRSHATMKGEAVVMVEFGDVDADLAGQSIVDEASVTIRDRAVREFAKGRSLKDLLKEFSGCGLGRSELYQLLLEVKSGANKDS